MKKILIILLLVLIALPAQAAITYQFKKTVFVYDHIEITVEFNDGAGLVWQESKNFSRDDVAPYTTLVDAETNLFNPWVRYIIANYQKLRAINTAINNNLNVTITP